jgi:hypothetical protein
MAYSQGAGINPQRTNGSDEQTAGAAALSFTIRDETAALIPPPHGEAMIRARGDFVVMAAVRFQPVQ